MTTGFLLEEDATAVVFSDSLGVSHMLRCPLLRLMVQPSESSFLPRSRYRSMSVVAMITRNRSYYATRQ